MSTLKSIVYALLAPLLRRSLKNRIAVKRIKGSKDLMLTYPADQHLGFLGQREIEYEYSLQQQLLREIEKGYLIFEIGSNIGQYSLVMADKTGNEGKLICIEPDSDNFAFLDRNVKANKLDNIILLNKAVGEREGTLEFFKDSITGGRMSSLVRKHTGDHFQGKTEKVAVTTLAHLIETYGIPHLIKVDTEGAEIMIFASMPLLPTSTTYFVEVRSETANAMYYKFSEQRFNIYSLDHNMKQIKSESDLVGFDNWLVKYEY